MALQRRSPTTVLAALLLAAALIAATPAQADVGIERSSRSAGAPGDTVAVTIGCGACLAIGAPKPPASFPVSLVPLAKAPKPRPCGPRTLCSPEVLAPPSRPPYSFLGRATPLTGGGARKGPPWSRYRLRFEIPDLRPGLYAYVVFCGICADGGAGSLIAEPMAHEGRLRIRATTARP